MSDQPSLRENSRRLFSVQESLAAMYRQLPWSHKLMQGLWFALLTLIASGTAYGLGTLLHAQQAFWAALTAVTATQQNYIDTRTSARDQLIGAAVGGVAGFGATLVMGEQFAAYAAAIVVSITACWAFGLGVAARLSGVTATLILLVPHTGSFWWIALERVGQVALGIGCTLAVVMVAERVQRWWVRPTE